MHQFLGDTGIRLYDFVPTIGIYLTLLFLFLYTGEKKQFPGKTAQTILNRIHNDKVKNVFLIIFSLIDFVLLWYMQFNFRGVLNIGFGDLVGTGANYFATLFATPLMVAVACFVFGLDFFKTYDLAVPAYPLFLFFAKLGCFFQGCCRGIECSFGLYNHNSGKVEFPVQLVEAGLVLLIFVFLLFWRKRAKEGTMFPMYLLLYSATRFFSEFLRCEENVFWILKTYHLLCLAGILVAVVQFIIVAKCKDKIKRLYEKGYDFIIRRFIIAPVFKLIDGISRSVWRRKRNKKNKKAKNVSQSKKKNKRKNSNYVKAQVEKPSRKANIRMWILIWTLGLIGQIGWNVEGTWLNTFVYAKVDKDPSIITPMLIASALASTVAIFLCGTLTDRTGKRRTLISTGFVVWGLLTVCFGFTQFISKSFLFVTVLVIVLIDTLLSFFASMSTDVGYSTWLTDVMNDQNRGQIGGAIAVQCVLGSLLGNIIGGYLVGTENNYLRLFIVVGAFLSLVGLVSVFLFNKKDDVAVAPQGSFLKQFTGGLNFKKLLQHKQLLWVYAGIAVFFIGYDTYIPHLGNFLIHYLGYSPEKMGIIEAIPMVLAMIVTLPVSKLINNNKYIESVVLSVGTGLVGILSVFTITPADVNTEKIFNLRMFCAIFLVAISYIVMLQTTKAWTKNLLPEESRGQFEGFFAVSFALIPMTCGSNIGSAVIKLSGETFFNELTARNEYIPNGKVFLVGVLISTLSIIPFLVTKKYMNKKQLTKHKK